MCLRLGRKKDHGRFGGQGTERPKYLVVIHMVEDTRNKKKKKDTRNGDGEIVESKVKRKDKSVSQGCKP